MIRVALARADSNQTRAAKLLGVSERMFRYKLKKYGFKWDTVHSFHSEENDDDETV